MPGDNTSSGQAVLGVDEEVDPFDTTVKVRLPDAQGTSSNGDAVDKDPGQTDKDQKDEGAREEPKFSSGEHEEAEEGGEDDRARSNLRASRRHAKKLRRQLDSKSAYITALEQRVAHSERTSNMVVRSLISSQINAKRAELERYRSTKLQARQDADAQLEQSAEDAIAKTLQDIQQLEANSKELESFEPARVSNAMLSDWLGVHSDWYQKRGYEEETREAQRISQELASQGIGQYDPRHFEKINERLAERYPELFDDTAESPQRGAEPNKGRENRNERMRGPVGGGSRQGGGGGGGGGQRHVPRALVETFKAAGYDVSKPEVQEKMWNRYNETQNAHGLKN